MINDVRSTYSTTPTYSSPASRTDSQLHPVRSSELDEEEEEGAYTYIHINDPPATPATGRRATVVRNVLYCSLIDGKNRPCSVFRVPFSPCSCFAVGAAPAGDLCSLFSLSLYVERDFGTPRTPVSPISTLHPNYGPPPTEASTSAVGVMAGPDALPSPLRLSFEQT